MSLLILYTQFNKDQELHQIEYKGSKVTFVFSIKRGHITTVLNLNQENRINSKRYNEQ